MRYLPKGHVEMRTSQLLFHGVQLSDAGRYTCRSVKDPTIERVFHLVSEYISLILLIHYDYYSDHFDYITCSIKA